MRNARRTALLAALLLVVGCRDFADVVGPDPHRATGPVASHSDTGLGIQGQGSIGSGQPEAGGNRQDFEFDVAADLTGHLFYRDWSIVRPDGTTATFTVSADDAGTRIEAFRDGSEACSDPTSGAEFDGVGRLDTGELAAFTVAACDGGPPGSGQDAFRISVPDAGGYAREGALSSGDIVKSDGSGSLPTFTRATGLGAIGQGDATPGSDRQEFDFEANATPGGRLTFIDYTVVRADGSAGHMTVDPDDYPDTGVTSFQQLSATCVRFGGTGRLDTGELWAFFVDACDEADPGVGFDRFTITLPDRAGPGVPFTRSGTLTSGDIVLSGDAPAPTTGDLTVTTSTTGSNLDPDGYTVTVGGTDSRPIPINGSVTFGGLAAGEHSVVLSGVASNCMVSGGTTRSVTVPAGGTASIDFAVHCESAPATRLVFTVQPSNTATNATIRPPVQVTALDAQGNPATSFDGSVTIAIGRNGGGLLTPGRLSGTRTVAAVDGVATFADLSINRSGDYTLRVTSSGLTGAESQTFRIGSSGRICLLGICLL
jgi:hypothetical protein